jgi:hypothetical protein
MGALARTASALVRILLVAGSVVVLAAVGYAGFLYWQYTRLFPAASTEVVQLTPGKRATLQRLRSEAKFKPHNYPPLGYTGADTPEDGARATAAVNEVIDAVLSRSDGPIQAKIVIDLIGHAMGAVDMLATEDRDRTQEYMLEIWYILGFKGATGHFAYGSAFQKPDGYGEPLPPGWTAPDKPRPIE